MHFWPEINMHINIPIVYVSFKKKITKKPVIPHSVVYFAFFHRLYDRWYYYSSLIIRRKENKAEV